MNELRKQNSNSHERIFERLGDLEKQEGIQGEQFKHIIDKLTEMTSSIDMIKSDNREIISKIYTLTHRTDALEKITGDVDELKERPAKRWEGMVGQIISLIIAAVFGIIVAKLGI